MKTTLTVFIFFIVSSVFSQSWCDPGANWKYDQMSFGVEGYLEIQYTGDTIIDGQTSNILDKHSYVYDFISSEFEDYDMGKEYTYESSNVVYIRSNNTWDTLYNFDAGIGDSWKMPKRPLSTSCNSTNIFTVTSTGNTSINGLSLKYLVLEFSTPSGYIDTIIEKIGFTGSYLYPIDYCDSVTEASEGGPFRCYYDGDFSLYKPNSSEVCDFIVGLDENNLSESIKIVPNPTHENFQVTGVSNIKARYTITDSSGKEWSVDKLGDEIQINSLKSGMYILNIYYENGVIHKRFIKH